MAKPTPPAATHRELSPPQLSPPPPAGFVIPLDAVAGEVYAELVDGEYTEDSVGVLWTASFTAPAKNQGNERKPNSSTAAQAYRDQLTKLALLTTDTEEGFSYDSKEITVIVAPSKNGFDVYVTKLGGYSRSRE